MGMATGTKNRDETALAAAVALTGHRVTAPRKAVASLIADRQGHFTAADLLADAKRQRLRLGRATVFRSLELFTELGALERLDLPSGEHAYIACEPEHHHHVVCRSCGRSVEVEDSGLQSVVAEIARRSGYVIDTHRLELFGLCPLHRDPHSP
jgi:Fur family transcriptional regulator, ferric uptake regulator